MLRAPIIAYDVQNLSDARYFAAAGAQALVFCIPNTDDLGHTINKIEQIKEWVEGVEIGVVFPDSTSLDRCKELMNAINPNFWMYKDSCECIPLLSSDPQFILTSPRVPVLPREQDSVVLIADRTDLNEFLSSTDQLTSMMHKVNQVFIQADFSADELRTLLDLYPNVGFVLQGGTEEKVGFKSFEDLDILLEVLEY